MALPQYRDEVLVTLTSVDPPSSFAFPDRRFFLSKEKPIMDIGRTSKRNSSLEAGRNNAWFDSAVMSRDHAQLKLDVDKQKVYIKDVGSLHGTFKNEQRLSRHAAALLSCGDHIRFGITIDRGSDKFPPCVMEAQLEFGNIDPDDRPKVFRVPDDSDVEESNSDGEDESVRDSSEILRKVNVRPAIRASSPSNYSPRYSPIDLTSNDQYPTSNIREDEEHNNGALPLPSAERCADVSSSSQTKPVDCSDYSPVLPASAPWLLGSEDQDVEIHLSESTDMDTDSSVDNRSTNTSTNAEAHSIRILSANLEDTDSDDEEFEGNGVFEDYIPEDISYSEAGDDVIDESNVNDEEPSQVSSNLPSFTTENDQTLSQGVVEVTHEESVNKASGSLFDGSINGMSYVLNYPVPPNGHQQTQLGSPWLTNPPLAPLRLPSISEAVSSAPPPPIAQVHAGPKNLAGLLGAKTGKHEYFAAREENRINVMGSYPHNESNLTNPIPDASANDFSSNSAKLEFSNNAEESYTENVTLDESGVKFLNSPPIDDLQIKATNEIPVLDETSAYQFEMSKKKVASTVAMDQGIPETPVGTGKRTRMEIDDMLQAPDHSGVEPPPAQTPAKRKAEEISDLVPEERERIFKERKEKAVKRLVALAKRSRASKVAAKSNASERVREPSSKRLRHVAEAFGYVALGGVAVMTALIATAPTL